MFVVDGSYEKGTFFRKRFTGLQAGVPYNFTAFIANINKNMGTTKPNVSFEIYNSSTGDLITTVSSGNIAADSIWHGVSIAFTSSVSDIELVLRNNALGTIGNDLALDDISFSLSIPRPEATTVYSCESNSGTIGITAPVAAPGSPIGYEYSIDGVNWQANRVFSGVSAGTYTLYVRYETATGCISQGEVAVINDCTPMPVTLLSFNAEKNNRQVHLNWSTAKEENNKGFELQRSTDGADWANIGFTNSLANDGNSTLSLRYKFVDAAPETGLNFYRLKQLDYDGNYNYSSVRSVNLGASEAIMIYPNPIASFVKIEGLSGNYIITIFNSLGQQVRVVKSEQEPIKTMDLSLLPSGVYTITVEKENGDRISEQLFKL